MIAICVFILLKNSFIAPSHTNCIKIIHLQTNQVNYFFKNRLYKSMQSFILNNSHKNKTYQQFIDIPARHILFAMPFEHIIEFLMTFFLIFGGNNNQKQPSSKHKFNIFLFTKHNILWQNPKFSAIFSHNLAKY